MSRRLAALLPFAVFLFLAAVSWNRWLEPFVDGGRELMVPWRVANGETLYRDVRFYYGPLGPYLAAAVDLAAGRSLPARIALAAVVALLHVAALGALARRLLPSGPAALAAALTVGVTFFLRPGGCHLFPYSLDTAIAVAAVTGALLAASATGSSSSPAAAARRDRYAAVALTAALLARPELGLAGIGAIAFERVARGDAASRRRLAALAGIPLAVAAIAYAALSVSTPFHVLRREGWLTFLFLPPEFRNVYASFSGVDRPAFRLAELALALIALLGAGLWLLLAAVLSDRAERGARSRSASRTVEIAAIAALGAIAWLRLRPPASTRATVELLPPLVRALPPLLVAVAVVGIVRRLSRRRGAGAGSILPGVPDAIGLVALFFALRLLLAAGYVGPYNGFYLPLPLLVGTALLVSAAERFPERLAGGTRPPGLRRLVLAALGVFLAARMTSLALAFRHPAWSRVATPAGAVYAPEPVAGATRAAFDDLAGRLSPGAGLIGFPEAGFFQWTLGLTNPLAQDQFFPGHLDAAAESEAIERLRRDPAEAAVFVNVLTIGHGPAAFGSDYLQRLDRAVRQAYPVSRSFGPGARQAPRIGDPGFFIEIRSR